MARSKKKARRSKHINKSPLQDNTPTKYIDPNFGDDTCQGGEKSSLFWLKQIPEVFPDLHRKDKIVFINDMISQAYASLHKKDHKEIWLLLYNFSKDDKGVCGRLKQLQMVYIEKNKNFKCTCGSEINPEVFKDKEHVKICKAIFLKIKPTKYIDPNFGDKTCQGGEKSALFWLKQIPEVFPDLHRKGKLAFIKNMVSQAYASLHKRYHKEICLLLYNFSKDDLCVSGRVRQLQKAYIKKNMNFKCTCGSEINPEVFEDYENVKIQYPERSIPSASGCPTKEVPPPPGFTGKTTPSPGIPEGKIEPPPGFPKKTVEPTPGFINDKSQGRSNKRSVEDDDTGSDQKKTKEEKNDSENTSKPKRPMSSFFLFLNENRDQIEKDIPGLSNKQICKKASELFSAMEDKTKWYNMHLKKKAEYDLAMEVWKAGLPLQTKSPVIAIANPYFGSKIPDSPETNKKDDTETDITYEGLLDILELND